MKKHDLKCLLCGGKIIHNEVKHLFTCSKCNVEHATELFPSKSIKRGKINIRYPKLKLFFALAGALYILYLTLRIFYY